MILYCFITHQAHLQQTRSRVGKMMAGLGTDDYMIVVGGYDATEYLPSEKVLQLPCNDLWEGLPEKVQQLFCFLAGHQAVQHYSHFFKCDEDIRIHKRINPKKLRKVHYGGVIYNGPFNRGYRRYHIGRCSKASYFYRKPYTGPAVPYCLGGTAYVLSRRACRLIAAHKGKLLETDIYEDLAVGKILYGHNIYPVNLEILMWNTIVAPEHNVLRHPIRVYLSRLKRFSGYFYFPCI